MIQIVAKLRRAAAFTAAVASLAVLSPGASSAQAPPPPPADTTAKPAAADTASKHAAQPAPSAGAQSATPAPAPTSPPATTAGKSGKSSKSSSAAKTPKTPKASKPKAPKAAAAAVAAPVGKSYEERRKEDGVYAKGANWIGLRFGYANRTGELSGDGSIGYGASYTRMLTNRYAFSTSINHDIVGRFAEQIDIAVPFTGEFQRHFKMGGEMRSYLGVGGGYYFRKFYRTGTEYNTTTTGGAHVSIGLTSQLDDKHVIGFETRVAWVRGRPGVTNPTFGIGSDTETIWTAKLTWALVY